MTNMTNAEKKVYKLFEVIYDCIMVEKLIEMLFLNMVNNLLLYFSSFLFQSFIHFKQL